MIANQTATVKTIDGNTILDNELIANRTGFSFDPSTGEWFNCNNEPTNEKAVGYCAFYCPDMQYSDLTSADMRQGWLDASGFEDYQSMMYAEARDEQRNGWMN